MLVSFACVSKPHDVDVCYQFGSYGVMLVRMVECSLGGCMWTAGLHPLHLVAFSVIHLTIVQMFADQSQSGTSYEIRAIYLELQLLLQQQLYCS